MYCIIINNDIKYMFTLKAGEGRRPWATTISPSVPPHLTFPGKTNFSNVIFSAFKVWLKKIQPRHAKNHNSNQFFNST